MRQYLYQPTTVTTLQQRCADTCCCGNDVCDAGERGSAAAGQDDDFELENEQTACAREVHDGEGDTWWKSSGDNDNVTFVRCRDVK